MQELVKLNIKFGSFGKKLYKAVFQVQRYLKGQEVSLPGQGQAAGRLTRVESH